MINTIKMRGIYRIVWYREGTAFVHFTEFCGMRYLIFLFYISIMFACQDAGTELIVVPEQLAMRDTAGQKSKEIGFLKKGEKVKDLGLVSNFETIVALKSGVLQSPWIKVVNNKDQQGWVLAALFLPVEAERAAWLENKRLVCYFGHALTQRRANWLATGTALATASQVAAYYREAVALRDTFMTILSRRAEPNETTAQLDYSWLKPVFPGFIAQKISTQNHPFLFANFNYWMQIAQQSQGRQDDLFFETAVSIFSQDSIESFFPDWTFQLDDVSAASQLGSGTHLKLLTSIEKNLAAGELFREEMLHWKENLLADIAGKDVYYWQPAEKILTELQKIVDSNFSYLETSDQMVLQTRLEMFKDPAANGIRVNMRSGE
jgi:Bacterial SH3 domain